jgi:hypothetical protein
MRAQIERRDVLKLVAALPGMALLGWEPARASAPASPVLFAYHPAVPESVWRPLAQQHGASAAQAIEGDRVRFARAWLSCAPQSIGGLTGYADLLILAGAAEEEGFRMREELRVEIARREGKAVLLYWRMQRRTAGAATPSA